jgi:hypothetical protein
VCASVWVCVCVCVCICLFSCSFGHARSSPYRPPNQDRTFAADLLCRAQLGPDDVFVDVGSGLGKLSVLAVCVTGVKQVWGLELSTSRHAAAEAGADAMQEAGMMTQAERGRLHYWQGDCGVEDGLPSEVLWATAFLLTIKDSRGSTRRFLNKLIAQKGRPKTRIWTVAHALPQQAGLRLVRTLCVDGYERSGLKVLPGKGAGEAGTQNKTWRTKDFIVYEYSLDISDVSTSTSS